MVELRALVLELLSDLRAPPASDREPLDLDSLGLVLLVEALEERLSIRIGAAEVVPENFASLGLVLRFLEGKR